MDSKTKAVGLFSPYQKRNDQNEHLILTLRKERKLGARRLQTELQRLL